MRDAFEGLLEIEGLPASTSTEDYITHMVGSSRSSSSSERPPLPPGWNDACRDSRVSEERCTGGANHVTTYSAYSYFFTGDREPPPLADIM